MDDSTHPPTRSIAPRRNQAGFTLLELLLVVVVVGVLAAIATPVYLDKRIDAYDAAATSDLHTAAVQAAIRVNDGDDVSSAHDLGSPHAEDVVLQLVAYDPSVGYCLSARHEGSPHTWYWDSVRGGLQPEGTECAPDAFSGSDGDEVGGDVGSDRERHCNNGVNPGNVNRCVERSGQNGNRPSTG